jgi:hypothetical protein
MHPDHTPEIVHIDNRCRIGTLNEAFPLFRADRPATCEDIVQVQRSTEESSGVDNPSCAIVLGNPAILPSRQPIPVPQVLFRPACHFFLSSPGIFLGTIHLAGPGIRPFTRTGEREYC